MHADRVRLRHPFVAQSLRRLVASPMNVIHPRRHPLCPSCRYDLVVTVAAGRRVCPECGYEFEMDELITETLPGDWTIWRGLRRALMLLAGRSLLWTLAWILVIWGATALVARTGDELPLVATWVLQLTAGLAILGVGASIGPVLVRRMAETAGFEGSFLATIIIAFAWTSIVAAIVASRLLGTVGGSRATVLVFLMGAMATAWVVRALMMEEM